jgi:hypothetical protein
MQNIIYTKAVETYFVALLTLWYCWEFLRDISNYLENKSMCLCVYTCSALIRTPQPSP